MAWPRWRLEVLSAQGALTECSGARMALPPPHPDSTCGHGPSAGRGSERLQLGALTQDALDHLASGIPLRTFIVIHFGFSASFSRRFLAVSNMMLVP